MKAQVVMATLLFSFCSLTYATTYTVSDLQDIRDKLNKDYPEMIDKSTKLLKVSVDPKAFHYHYEVVDAAASDYNIPKFNKLMKESLVKTVCKNKYAVDVLNSNFDISFDYIDKNKQPITNVVVTKSDCPADVTATAATTSDDTKTTTPAKK